MLQHFHFSSWGEILGGLTDKLSWDPTELWGEIVRTKFEMAKEVPLELVSEFRISGDDEVFGSSDFISCEIRKDASKFVLLAAAFLIAAAAAAAKNGVGPKVRIPL